MEVAGIPVDVVWKDIKNLHVGVYPPDGRVRVAAPLRLDSEAVRLAIVSRLGWIRRRQEGFERQDRQSKRNLVSGESHYFRGRRYLLDVEEANAAPHVSVINNRTLRVVVRPGDNSDRREVVVREWYRSQLREQVSALVPKWEVRIGVRIAAWRIRRMKTRWGTCNPDTRRILLNLELAKKSESCTEFILVHEMVHLLERYHNEVFMRHMDRLFPQWRLARDNLNQTPLAHEKWAY